MYGDQISMKADSICSMYVRDEKCIQNFSKKI